jgi:Zn-finger nucleic acid-binding protein
MSERQSVEIDYCPRCRGVWLDRGELDKLIERSAQQAQAAAPAPAAVHAAPAPASAQPYPPAGYGYPHKRKYKSWLDEIFD